MTLDLSKYGVTPIDEVEGNDGVDLSQYGATPVPTDQMVTPPRVPTGVGGIKGTGLGAVKSFASGVVGLGSMIQGLGQRGLAALPGVSLEQVRATTGIPALQSGSPENLAIEEKLRRYGKAEKLGAAAETVAEFALPLAWARRANKAFSTLKYLKSTPETLTTVEERSANLAGRVKKTIVGGKKYILPSKSEIRAAEILRGKISSNVTKNPPIIQKEIAKLGGEVEKYLAKNKVAITAKEQAEMFATKRKAVEKSLDKTQLKAFDEQWKMFQKQLPGRGGYNTENFYKGLKDYETNVASQLPKGKAALQFDATGVASAKLVGAKAVRKIVRDLLGAKHPEFKSRMFDLASLYDVLDTALIKSRKLGGTTVTRFMKKHPVLTKLGGATVGGAGAGVAGSYLLRKTLDTDEGR